MSLNPKFLRRSALWMVIAAFLPIPSGTSADNPPSGKVFSLFGTELTPPSLSPETQKKLEADLERATSAYLIDSSSVENAIWLGRRTAYLWRFREAIEIYTRAIERFPNDPRLYRHRGHRYITVRELDNAIADFEKAASLVKGKKDEIEPDGAPNSHNIPRSTLQSNIFYHLGLACYLKGDFQKALEAYRSGLVVARVNDDMLCAMSDWTYMTCRRLGKPSDAAEVLAPIKDSMDILEDTAYHRRLLMYKGKISPSELLPDSNLTDLDLATYGYAMGNWSLVNGDTAKAVELFRQTLAGPLWSAFGYIAAEAELKRLNGSRR